jgi:hypothetical protein
MFFNPNLRVSEYQTGQSAELFLYRTLNIGFILQISSLTGLRLRPSSISYLNEDKGHQF